jgi:hypothetical protein
MILPTRSNISADNHVTYHDYSIRTHRSTINIKKVKTGIPSASMVLPGAELVNRLLRPARHRAEVNNDCNLMKLIRHFVGKARGDPRMGGGGGEPSVRGSPGRMGGTVLPDGRGSARTPRLDSSVHLVFLCLELPVQQQIPRSWTVPAHLVKNSTKSSRETGFLDPACLNSQKLK